MLVPISGREVQGNVTERRELVSAMNDVRSLGVVANGWNADGTSGEGAAASFAGPNGSAMSRIVTGLVKVGRCCLLRFSLAPGHTLTLASFPSHAAHVDTTTSW